MLLAPAIMIPASAGPTIRDALNSIELSATALIRCSRPTSSTTNDWRTGLSIAVMMPWIVASTYTCQSWIAPVPTSMAKTAAWSSAATCVIVTRRCLGQRSVITPPISESNSTGRNWSAVTRPSAKGEWVSWSTSQSCAVRCIQLPVWEIIWPIQNSR